MFGIELIVKNYQIIKYLAWKGDTRLQEDQLKFSEVKRTSYGITIKKVKKFSSSYERKRGDYS